MISRGYADVMPTFTAGVPKDDPNNKNQRRTHMGLETAGHISGLNSAFPTATDGLAQGDDHIRLLKSTIQATFPNFTDAPLNSTQAQIDAAVAFSGGTQALEGDGTATAPSYTFTSETNTGWYKKAPGVLSGTILGTDAFDFSAAGLNILEGDLNVAVGGLKLAGTSVFPLSPAGYGAGSVLTVAIANANVTYGKIQNVTAARLLGNPTGSAASPSEISLGAGLAFSGSVLSAPAFPPAGVYRNKKIKVLTNTTASVAIDAVVVSDGTHFTTVAVANTLTLNAGLGLNQLDSATTISNGQWLYVYAIYNGSLVKVVASSSSTAPDLTNAAFTGYTQFAYMGTLHTGPATTSLMGTWQINNEYQYIVGLAQTTGLPQLVTGTGIGSVTTPTYVSATVSAVVPPNAKAIKFKLASGGASDRVIVAPNGNYGTFSNPANAPFVDFINGPVAGGTGMFSMVLESGNVFWATNTATASYIIVGGWDE